MAVRLGLPTAAANCRLHHSPLPHCCNFKQKKDFFLMGQTKGGNMQRE